MSYLKYLLCTIVLSGLLSTTCYAKQCNSYYGHTMSTRNVSGYAGSSEYNSMTGVTEYYGRNGYEGRSEHNKVSGVTEYYSSRDGYIGMSTSNQINGITEYYGYGNNSMTDLEDCED